MRARPYLPPSIDKLGLFRSRRVAEAEAYWRPFGMSAVGYAYDHHWRVLSEQLRASHPYCAMCHSSEGEEYMDAQGKIRAVRLTVDHIDGHPTNNELSNLRVICAACHGSLTSDTWRR